MITVNIGNNTTRKTLNCVDEYKTLREAFDEAGIDCSRGMVNLDGRTLQSGDLDNTFAYFGYDGSVNHDTCTLRVIAKADNA